MGKNLAIIGADFSANAVVEVLDFTGMLGAAWMPQKAIANLSGTNTSANNARCCIQLFDIQSLPNWNDYQYIRLTINNGYDYVFLVGDVYNTSKTRCKGTLEYDSAFTWVTNNQLAVSTMYRYICVNIRYDNNTTQFPSNAVPQDYIKLELTHSV